MNWMKEAAEKFIKDKGPYQLGASDLVAFAEQVGNDRQMLDITAPQGVEVVIRPDRKVVWVNVDGQCRLRCCQIGELEVKED